MSTLQLALQHALAARYPTVTASHGSRFLPMLDLSKGELSSTAAIEVARTLRGDAIGVAERLVADISEKVQGDWKVVAGYMILSQTPLEVLREEVLTMGEVFSSKAGDPTPRAIVCLVPDATTPLYARLRLIASAALQAHLTVAFEGRCRLGFGSEAPRCISSSREVVALVSEAVERCVGSEGERRTRHEVPMALLSSESPPTIWTSHHYHDRLPREAKQGFVDARNAGTGTLKIPPDGWLLSRERALSELLLAPSLKRVLKSFTTNEGWLRWIHHFASAIPSGDLDPSVSLYDECASPRWTLQVLHQRVSHLVVPHVKGDPRELVSQVVATPLKERDILIRALLLPLLTARAVREGEVLAWSTVVEDFASRAHSLLNSPAFRVSLTEEASVRRLMQINAGLVLGIVGILPAITED